MTPDYYFNFKLKKSTDVVRFFFRNTVALMVSVVLLNCNAQENNNYFPYDINNEDEKYVLPNVLAEISGLTEATNKKIYCLEDEHGVVYIYDFDKKKIVSKIKFGKDNDYEGLAMVNNELYALTSNGTLYRIDNVENKEKVKSTKISTFLKSNCDAEGLCYDKDKNRLLIEIGRAHV